MNAYIVIEHAGEDAETDIVDFPTARAAYRFIAEHYTGDERDQLNIDVMKRLPDGSLTTEF